MWSEQVSVLTADACYGDTACRVACMVSDVDEEHRHSRQDQVVWGPDGTTNSVSHPVLVDVDVVSSAGYAEHCVSTCVSGHCHWLVGTASKSWALCVWRTIVVEILNQRLGKRNSQSVSPQTLARFKSLLNWPTTSTGQPFSMQSRVKKSGTTNSRTTAGLFLSILSKLFPKLNFSVNEICNFHRDQG